MDAPQVQYVRTSDGYSIAYAISGEGRPLVLLPETFSHIQLYWTEDTFMAAWLRELASRFRIIQYDGRGQGMSSRGLGAAHTTLDHQTDLEAVIDRLGLERFVIVARTTLGHTALRYAASHPERVEALVLAAVPASGALLPTSQLDVAERNWDLFLSFAATSRSSESSRSVWRLKQTLTREDFLVLQRAWRASDVSALLPSVQTPTLLLHPRDFPSPRPEESMRLAGLIKGASLSVVDGSVGYGDTGQAITAVENFLLHVPHSEQPLHADLIALDHPPPAALSGREAQVLRLLAAGKSNREIADELVLSVNTVIRHVSNIYAKTGAANRAEATAYAAKQGLI
jgi:pimeloyl-ACP methyl ester carboxylesterase/DNA-binding CsgD family transcriptional regulator